MLVAQIISSMHYHFRFSVWQIRVHLLVYSSLSYVWRCASQSLHNTWLDYLSFVESSRKPLQIAVSDERTSTHSSQNQALQTSIVYLYLNTWKVSLTSQYCTVPFNIQSSQCWSSMLISCFCFLVALFIYQIKSILQTKVHLLLYPSSINVLLLHKVYTWPELPPLWIWVRESECCVPLCLHHSWTVKTNKFSEERKKRPIYTIWSS